MAEARFPNCNLCVQQSPHAFVLTHKNGNIGRSYLLSPCDVLLYISGNLDVLKTYRPYSTYLDPFHLHSCYSDLCISKYFEISEHIIIFAFSIISPSILRKTHLSNILCEILYQAVSVVPFAYRRLRMTQELYGTINSYSWFSLLHLPTPQKNFHYLYNSLHLSLLFFIYYSFNLFESVGFIIQIF